MHIWIPDGTRTPGGCTSAPRRPDRQVLAGLIEKLATEGFQVVPVASGNACMLSQVRSEAGKVRRADGSVAKSGVDGSLASSDSLEKVKKGLEALSTFASQSDFKVPPRKCCRSRLLFDFLQDLKVLSHFCAVWLTGWVKKPESATKCLYPTTL